MWKGREATDPEGYRCRIGALWSRLFLRRGWAMVAFGTVWFRDEKTFANYLRDDFWRAHEHHHVWQEKHRFRNSLTYLLAFVWQYVRYRSHDAAPLEMEADEAARHALASKEAQ
ncbi:MAG TPA: hypothetical protein PLL78_02355 [Fimbriimonadaceae bacterium]|nr:hypothetical protein [Fimbriimonadaceae bacterium]HRJ95500.1 hypothetical protein [Fimbriimonadaceae bacterium]